jgi:hypothetical protein
MAAKGGLLARMVRYDYMQRDAFLRDQEILSCRYHKYGLDMSRNTFRGICKWIIGQIRNLNQSVLLLCTGAPGSGKSYSSLAIMEAVDDSFDVDSVAFSPREFLAGLREGRKALLIDDIGTQLFSRDAMTKVNKQYSKLFEGLRFQNRCVCMTVPSASMVDKTLRTLSNLYLQTNSINRQSERVNLLARFQALDATTDKVYRYSPIGSFIGVINGKQYILYKRLFTINVPKPSDSLIAKYEAKKLQAFNEFVKRMEKDFSSNKKASNSISQKMPKKHKIIQKMVDMGLSIEQIADALDSNEKAIQDLLRYARSKENE